MKLDKNLTDRNYLYGRLYAIAEYFDVTNKGYYMHNFKVFPCRYWKHFYEMLRPKLQRLDAPKKKYFEELIEEIHDKFTPDTYLMHNERGDEVSLDGMYIMGFHNQSEALAVDMNSITA